MLQLRRRQIAAITLYAFVGGFADVTSLLRAKSFTGHVTGNIVLLMISVVGHEWHGALMHLLAIVCFLASTWFGIRLSRFSKSSFILFATQCSLLLPLALHNPATRTYAWLIVFCFCLSLGLQNGVVTSSLGVSVHSTFLSGDLTKLLKTPVLHSGSRPAVTDTGTGRVLACVISGFCVGAAAGAALTQFSLRTSILCVLLAAFAAWGIQTWGSKGRANCQEYSVKAVDAETGSH